MRGVFCMLIFGVFLQFSGGQRFQGSRRIFQRPELGRQFRNVDVLAGTPDSHSNADPSALQSAQHLRLRNFRTRSGLASNSRTSSNNLRTEEISLNSRGVPRRSNLQTPSRLNLQLRASQHDSVASSLPSQHTSFSRSSPNNHQSSSNIHHTQREISRTRQSHDFQSSFPERVAGNDVRNQASTQDAQLFRELQLLNSLLKENSTPLRTDQSANHNMVNNDFGAVSRHHMGNANDHIHQQPLQLPSHQSHDISPVSPNHLNLDAQPKIVLLRNGNSGKPLNVQIGNTRLEVLGSQSDSSQLVIQTLQNALGSAPKSTIVNQNVVSHVPGNSATHIPIDNQSLINVPTGNAQTAGQVHTNQNIPNTNTILELLNQLQISSTATGNTATSTQIKPAVAAANVPGPLNLNNIKISVTTTPAPVHVPMVTTPLAPSAALRQILGPGIPDAMLQRMAQEILPSELQRIDAIMTGRGQNQVPDPSNVAVLKVGNQTHTFDMGTTKKIKIEQYKNGPRAEVTSFHGSNSFKNRMVTEEPLEYDEILLRKVLQKMGGR